VSKKATAMTFVSDYSRDLWLTSVWRTSLQCNLLTD